MSDRRLFCQEAIEPTFKAVARTAHAQGWSEEEVAFALLDLAVANILAIRSNMDTEAAIADAVRSVHGVDG